MNISTVFLSPCQFIPTTTIRILLCHYKWNRTQLLQEYFEAENMDKFFTDIKIINPFDMPLRVGASNTNKWTECDICCGEITESMKCSLDCGHSYCKTCWNQYLTVNIVDEGLSQQLICMNPTCKIAITDEFIMDILDDTSVILKYKYFMTKNFVQVSGYEFLAFHRNRSNVCFSMFLIFELD